MRRIFSLLFLLGLCVALTSCSVQKAARKSVAAEQSDGRWKQVLQTLEDRRFTIRVDEFFFSGESSISTSSGNYISMQGMRGEIHLSPQVFPGSPLEHLNIIDEKATLTRLKDKRNGDMQFEMTVNGDKKWLWNTLLITVYPHSDKCFVQVRGPKGSSDIYKFSGKILDQAEK